MRWLDELFDELDLHDVRLVGHSYGGWMAALYALEFPERLDKLDHHLTIVQPDWMTENVLGFLTDR